MSELSDDTQPTGPIRMCLVGRPGAAKTGALCSLVNDLGLKLRYWNYDNLMDPLKTYIRPERKSLVAYETFTDKLKQLPQMGAIPAGIRPIGTPTAWDNGMAALNKFGTHGGIESWGPDTVAVFDSYTRMGEAAMRKVLAANQRSGLQPWQSDWGEAMRLQESLLEALVGDTIKCHIIVISHLTQISMGKDEKDQPVYSKELYPNALGNKLPPKVGSYFNSIILAKTLGTERKLFTTPMDAVDVKMPTAVASLGMVDVKDGLAKIFTAMRPELKKLAA